MAAQEFHRLPLGFYFNPKDADLLHHLRLKGFDKAEQYGLIRDREIYEKEMPCDMFLADDQELYFFTTLKNKFEKGNAKRKDRVVGTGTWRSQRTVPVLDPDSGHDILGFKTILNFFEKGTKNGSNWIMHEYTLPPAQHKGWAVCRIKRSCRNPSIGSSPSSSAGASPSSCVKRKATPLDHDHHNKRPQFCHQQQPQWVAAPTPDPISVHYGTLPATQSPVSTDQGINPPDIAEAAALDEFLPIDLSVLEDWDSYAPALTEYIHLTIPPDGHDIPAVATSDPPQSMMSSNDDFADFDKTQFLSTVLADDFLLDFTDLLG